MKLYNPKTGDFIQDAPVSCLVDEFAMSGWARKFTLEGMPLMAAVTGFLADPADGMGSVWKDRDPELLEFYNELLEQYASGFEADLEVMS
jgi:hypothetical protein